MLCTATERSAKELLEWSLSTHRTGDLTIA